MTQIRRSMFLAAFALATTLHAGTPTVPKPETPAEAPAKHSFLDPIEGFARDSILHPTNPFQLVPGKDPNGWAFVIEPYAWAMGIEGKTGVGGFPAMNVNVDAVNVLRHLDWAIFAKGEIRKGRWGVLGDGYYAALSGSGNLGGNLYQDGSLHLQQALASLALAYRIIDDRRGFLDVYAGARYNFLGIQMDLNTDSSGINALGGRISDAVASRISSAVQAQVAANKLQDAAAVAATVESDLSGKLLASQSKTKPSVKSMEILQNLDRDTRGHGRKLEYARRLDGERNTLRALDHSDLKQILASSKGAIREFIRTQAELDVAKLTGTVSSDVQNRADAAKTKLAKSISTSVENALPTHAAGDQWWIDPIVGLRGQINITRWLFLAAQGDVGGFGAGSQITWNTQATVGVNFTRNIFAELGYRYMYVDYNKNNFLYQINTFGLFSSIGVKF